MSAPEKPLSMTLAAINCGGPGRPRPRRCRRPGKTQARRRAQVAAGQQQPRRPPRACRRSCTSEYTPPHPPPEQGRDPL
jgi:hypothetical protein